MHVGYVVGLVIGNVLGKTGGIICFIHIIATSADRALAYWIVTMLLFPSLCHLIRFEWQWRNPQTKLPNSLEFPLQKEFAKPVYSRFQSSLHSRHKTFSSFQPGLRQYRFGLFHTAGHKHLWV